MKKSIDENTRKRVSSISAIVAAGLSIFIVVVFLRNFTFGFFPLLLVLAAFMWILGVKVREFRMKRNMAMLWSAIIVFIFGLLCLGAINNYINPSRAVFTNNDHHVLAVEGLHLKSTKDVWLAGDRDNAIFDNEDFSGGIVMGESSELELSGKEGQKDTIRQIPFRRVGFSVPVYERRRDTSYFLGIRTSLTRKVETYFKDMDCNSGQVFSSGDDIALIQNGTTIHFKVSESKDSLASRYTLTYKDGETDVEVESPFHTYIRKSYPLSAMFQNVEVPGFDLDGIVLYRTVFFDTQVDRVKKRYKKHGAQYRLAFTAQANRNTFIRIAGVTYNPNKENASHEFKADGKTVYSIGPGEELVPQFRLYREQDGVSIRYRMPKYRYLSADYAREGKKREELSFMIATTILEPDGSVNQLIPENILLYDIFDHPDNVFQMQPAFISFVSGATNDRLDLSLYSADGSINAKGLVAGNPFPQLAARGANASWILSVDNFKDPSLVRPGEIERPMSSRTIAIVLILVTLLSIVSLFIKNGQRYTFVEPMVYLVVLGFLTIRLFLLWRISVFPPVIATSVSEFNGIFRAPAVFRGFFTGGSSLTWIIRLLIIFYLGIISLKIWGVKNGSSFLYWTYRNRSKEYSEEQLHSFLLALISIIPIVFIIGALIIRLSHTTSRIACVLFPIILYFFFDFISNRLFGGTYHDDDDRLDLRYLWVLAVNLVSTSIYCFVADGGFGIIFLMYSVLNFIMRLIDAYLRQPKGKKKKEEQKISRWVYALSACAALIVIFSKSFLLKLLNVRGFALALFLILFFLYIIILLTFNIIRISNKKITFTEHALQFILIGFASIVLISGCSLFVPKLFEGKHIEYRLKVHADSPGKVLGTLETSTAERKFMEASVNDWIMGEYKLRGNTVSPFVGERGHGYFKIQPQSKVGALWGAQTTDISLSRYIIAEHGGVLAISLIIILGLLLLFCISFVSIRVWSKALITQIPLLLSIQALFVWMAVTQRFIFLGQDFPMISITSNLTSFVFIGLLMVLVITAITESTLCQESDEKEKLSDGTSIVLLTNRALSNHIIPCYLLIIGFLLLESSHQLQFYSPIKKESSTRYDVENSVNALKESLESLNSEFVEFQQNMMASQTKGRKKITDITKIPSCATPHACLRVFCNNSHYTPLGKIKDKKTEQEKNPFENHFEVYGESYTNFCRMAFDSYLEKGSLENNVERLIFMVKKKSRVDGELNVVYELKVNDRYYRRELPRTIRDSWKGNIVSAPVAVEQSDNISSVLVDNQLILYSIPREFTGAKKEIRIVKSLANNAVVVGKQKPQVLRKEGTCLLSEADNVLIHGKPVDLSSYGNVAYLAKNVMINGVSSFVYPLQDELYWMRPFSDGIRIDKASNDAQKEATNEDVYLTLSPKLTSAIYREIEKHRPNKMSSVVVADGDGNILALVDHKDPSHRINPNDSRRIVKKENELRLEGEYYWGQEAENYFGNKAITNLRFGPGSSQKPLVWTAVTTEYNDSNFWANLRLARIENDLMDRSDAGHYSTHYVAGTLLSSGSKNHYFQSLTGDEGAGVQDVTLPFYIYKSSNYYNAVMAFIGSYSYDDLKNGLSMDNSDAFLFKSLPRSWTRKDTTEYRMSFPIMRSSENGRPFAFKSIPSVETMQNADNSVLVKGLRENLGLPSSKNRAERLQIYNYETQDVRMRSDFAHPQESYFLNRYRQESNEMTRADNAIRYTALGAASVWQVSPLMMAQMYGKLISLNKNYALSLQPSDKKVTYQLFDIDGVPQTYDNIGNYAGIRSTFVGAMSQVFTPKGTGHRVFNNIRGLPKNNDGTLSAESLDGPQKTLYLYGKTGTINGNDELGHSHEDHLLAVVISDTKLEKERTIETYENMKFVVIYMADFDNQNWQASDAAVIDVVLSSVEFKHYMGIK